MAKIALSTELLKQQSQEMKNLSYEYDAISKRITGTLLSVNNCWSSALSNNCLGKINAAKKCCNDITETVGKAGELALQAANTFEAIDKALASGKEAVKDSAGNSAPDNQAQSKDPWYKIDYKWSSLFGLLGGFGIVGGLASTAGQFFSGKGTVKDFLKFINNGLKNIDFVVNDKIPDAGSWWKSLFGTAVTAGATKPTWGEAIAKEVGKYADFSSGAKTFSTITKWVGVGVSAAVNGISNYEDYKDGKQSGGRAVAETITETAVDVGKGIFITAGLAAAGATGGVAVVGAVAASWVLDVGTKWITKAVTGEEKGFTEAVSDLALGAGKAIIDTGKKVAESVGKSVGKAAKSVKKGAKAAWNAIFG